MEKTFVPDWFFAVPYQVVAVQSTPMADPHIDVRYVANLARIDLSNDEVARFGTQLEDVMGYIKKLGEVDVEGIEPYTHPMIRSNRVRKDEPASSLPAEGFLQNTPDQANGQLRVPKVVDA